MNSNMGKEAWRIMNKIKMCGLSSKEDIEAANEIRPDYIGFVFAKKSRRYVTYEQAAELRKLLDPAIKAVGVFTDPTISDVEELLANNVIDMVQLHGTESEHFTKAVKTLCKCPVIKTYKVKTVEDIRDAEESCADYILFDSGAGTGNVFDWNLLKEFRRPYFLAGGLNPDNVSEAVERLDPFCLDVSSGIETNGRKDKNKMDAFSKAVRKELI